MSKIDVIINNFDFVKVHDVMTHLDWSWFDTYGVPSIEQMKVCARKLLEYCSSALDTLEEYNISTGGFFVHGYTANGFKELSLKFIVTEYSSTNY